MTRTLLTPRLSAAATNLSPCQSGLRTLPIPLPTDKEIITILRATHKYKDSREQFERRTHKRLIDVICPTQKTTDALQKLEIPTGVDVVMELK